MSILHDIIPHVDQIDSKILEQLIAANKHLLETTNEKNKTVLQVSCKQDKQHLYIKLLIQAGADMSKIKIVELRPDYMEILALYGYKLEDFECCYLLKCCESKKVVRLVWNIVQSKFYNDILLNNIKVIVNDLNEIHENEMEKLKLSVCPGSEFLATVKEEFPDIKTTSWSFWKEWLITERQTLV